MYDNKRRTDSWDGQRSYGREEGGGGYEREFGFGDQDKNYYGVETEDIDREFMGGGEDVIEAIDDRYASPSVRNNMHHHFTPSLREAGGGRDVSGKLKAPLGDAWA